MKEIDGVNPRILRYLGYSAYENGNPDAALDALQKFISNPSSKIIPRDYLYIGQAKIKKGTAAEGKTVDPTLLASAIVDIKKAVEMEPLAANELNELGKKLYDQKAFTAAAAVFEVAVTNPTSKNYLLDNFYLGNSLYYDNTRKDVVKPDPIALQKADVAFGNVITASPTTQDAYIFRARTNTLLENDEMMATYYQQYIDVVTAKGEAEVTKNKTKFIESYNNIAAHYANSDKAKAIELNDSLKGQYLANIFERSKLGSAAGSPLYSNFVDASKIAENLSGTRDSKKIYNLMFKNVDERKQIDGLLKNLAYSQGTIDKKTGLPGGVFIQLKQAGALGSALSYGASGNLAGLLADKGLATILIAPAAFSKIMLNPKVNKFLFEETTKQNVGKISPAKSGILFRNLVGRLVDEGYVNSEEGLKAIEESKQVQSEFEKAGIKNVNDFNKKPVVQQPAPQMPAVNTRVTNLQTQAVAPQVAAPKPVAGGVTNIPQERIDQYTNLFGRI
jgi:hypothetical protein